ncbi:MAG: AraC family transcriptional regulator [Polyangiales bacterium]
MITAQPLAPVTRPRIGLRVDFWQTTRPGRVSLTTGDSHRIKVHAGDPTRCRCAAHHSLYRRGDVDIMPAGFSDTWQEDDPSEAVLVEVTPALLARTAEDLGLDARRVSVAMHHQLQDARIAHIAWALDAERRAGAPSGLLYAESLGTALAAHLLGHYRAPLAPPRGLSRPQLARVRDYVEAHLDRDLSLGELSQVAALSSSHFKTQFKRATGLTVHAYVVQRRVARAEQLLKRGAMPAAQVALEAGFSHQSHMARCMRRVLGVTPSALARASSRG